MKKTYILRIYRGVPKKQYWEEFELEYQSGDNVISALMEIQKNPVNREGKRVEPVAWEQGCLEEVCGSCSILVNGKPRQACTALIKTYMEQSNIITLAPFSKFPLIRDLVVDRTRMFEALKKIRGWIDADGSWDRGKGPTLSPEVQDALYELSTCMTCGCCLEGCPQVNHKSKFIGPAAISQVRYFNSHPTGKLSKRERLEEMMEDGGVTDCGNAQNCARVCPKNIPLTESIAVIGREVSKQSLKNLFGTPDSEKNS